jgi:hypothetical protein
LSVPTSSPLSGFHHGISPEQGPHAVGGGGKADAGAGDANSNTGEADRARPRTAKARPCPHTAVSREDNFCGPAWLELAVALPWWARACPRTPVAQEDTFGQPRTEPRVAPMVGAWEVDGRSTRARRARAREGGVQGGWGPEQWRAAAGARDAGGEGRRGWRSEQGTPTAGRLEHGSLAMGRPE